MSFRIDPTRGLSQQEIVAAKNSLESLKNDEYYFRRCDLIVRHQLQFGQTLYLRGECTTHGYMYPLYGWGEKTKLINIGPDTWTFPVQFFIKKTDQVAFKFFVDENDWEEGENHNFQDLLLLTQKSSPSSNSSSSAPNYSTPSNDTRPSSSLSGFRFGSYLSWAGFVDFLASLFENPIFSSSSNAPGSSSSSSRVPNYGSSTSSGPSFNSSQSEPEMYNGKGFNNKDEVANYIKNILENTFGNSFSDSKSLDHVYRRWALKNHPDKVTDRENATERFTKVTNLMDDFKKFKGRNY